MQFQQNETYPEINVFELNFLDVLFSRAINSTLWCIYSIYSIYIYKLKIDVECWFGGIFTWSGRTVNSNTIYFLVVNIPFTLDIFFFEKHCFYIALCTLYLVLLLRKNMCIFGVFRPNFAHKSLPLSIYMEYTRGIVNLSLFSSTLFFPVSTNFFFKAFCLLESFFYFHCISFENLFHAI